MGPRPIGRFVMTSTKRIAVLITLAAGLLLASSLQAKTPLNVVTDGPYDFEFVAQTSNLNLAETTGDIFLEFMHRNTLEVYTAQFAGGFKKGETRKLRLDFPDESRIEDIKWYRVYQNSPDEWIVGQIRIYDGKATLYYELDQGDDQWDVNEWIDGLAGWKPPHYSIDMVQFLPVPALRDYERQIRVKLVSKEKRVLTGDLTIRLFHRNRTVPEVFTFPPSASKEPAYDITLSNRLGEYRKTEITAGSGDKIRLENVEVYAKHPDGRYHKYFDRDIGGDGHNWSAVLDGGKSISLDLVGASVKHRWAATAASTDVVIENYFQGYEIWPGDAGIGYANAAFLETLAMAQPGTREDKNFVSVSLYKGRYTHDGLAGLYEHISAAAGLPFTDAKFMLQKYEDLNDPNLRYYRTDHGVMTEREKTMMHNKFVLVKKTGEGPTVTTSSMNWSTNSHGRWQSSVRISGIYDLWLGYQRYFDNLFKYDPRTNLADIDHSFQPDGYWGGTPNLGSEFSEAVVCPAACEGPGVHEYADKYDISEIALDDLRIKTFFYPRDAVTDNSPMRDEFAELLKWLDADPNRRAEVYIMHLSQRDKLVYEKIHDLHAHPRADVKILVSLKGNPPHMHGAARYQGRTKANVTGLDAKFSQAKYEVHSKNVAIKKWHLDEGRPVSDGVVLWTGSYNMIESTLTDRDENLVRIEWTGADDPTFEQFVYRPHLDQLMRAWNNYKFSLTVGKLPRTTQAATSR